MVILSATVIAFLVMFCATVTWSIIAMSWKKKQIVPEVILEQSEYLRARMAKIFPLVGVCVSCGKEYYIPGLLPRHADETHADAKIPNRRCRPNNT